MNYVEALNYRNENENFEFISRLFEVRAKCTGNKPLQAKKFSKRG
jgi:hypothetical protein